MNAYINRTTSLNVIIDLLFVLFLPLLIIPIIGLVLFFSFSNVQASAWDILIVFLSMFTGFCIIPYFYLKKKFDVSIRDFGMKTLNWRMVIIGVVTLILVEGYLFYTNHTILFLLVNSVQMVIVAFTEEFWARGAICFLLAKISRKPLFIIMISSLCFAFLTHFNEPVLDNLLYRLPGALIMGVIYVRTGNLFYTFLFHFSYNMIYI